MDPKIQEKAWDPKIESEIRKTWDESGIYDFTIKDSNYTIDTRLLNGVLLLDPSQQFYTDLILNLP